MAPGSTVSIEVSTGPAQNDAPVADAGLDQAVAVGDTVTLDGSGSSDVDGDPLTFSWSLTTPPGSTAVPRGFRAFWAF